MSHGVQNAASESGTAKSAGMTPSTRHWWPSIRTVAPAIDVSAPSSRHRRWLMTINRSRPMNRLATFHAAPSYSSAANVRPSRG
jgi:hypothetical protein